MSTENLASGSVVVQLPGQVTALFLPFFTEYGRMG